MDAFIARQPIFDQDQRVFAYELLFRSGLDNVFRHPDPDKASSKIIADSTLLWGIEALTGGKKAFINATRYILIKEYFHLLPSEWAAVEILETVESDPEVIAACRKLKQTGYPLVLDDFDYEKQDTPLVNMADIIKVDMLTTSKEEQRSLAQRFAPVGVHLLAEKVETWEVFQDSREMGYTYFQGYFFSKPMILSIREVPAFKLHYLEILREIHRPDLDFDQIEEIIKQEASLSYKLLRYINSVFFGLRCKVRSIKQALVLLGEREIKKWASLVLLTSMGEDKPEELIVQTIVRAKFLESLASKANLSHRADDLFLTGLFSLIDAIIGRPLFDILQEIPIEQDIKAALLGERNPLRDVYEYALAYEKGHWEALSKLESRLGIEGAESPQLYREAVAWGHQGFYGETSSASEPNRD